MIYVIIAGILFILKCTTFPLISWWAVSTPFIFLLFFAVISSFSDRW